MKSSFQITPLWKQDHCKTCLISSRCGETPEYSLLGRSCQLEGWDVARADCDEMDPQRLEPFLRYLDDVDGLTDWTFRPFSFFDPASLPDYLPAVKNGSRRILRLEQDWVAIPLFKILRTSPGGGYGCRFESEAELRQHFMIADGAKILAVGVDHDSRLERFWSEHRSSGVITSLARLGLAGVTAPNYSLFTDSNRFQHLRNLKRILKVCERLSLAGIPVIPHVNAHNDSDWRFWGDFLHEHSEVTTVCKEFQTGPKNQVQGTVAIKNLAKLRERAGREVHCVLVGGSAFYQVAKGLLGRSFSVTDSRPFMLALSRRLLCRTQDGGITEVSCPTLPGQGVDHILHQDIAAHIEKMRSSGVVKRTEKKDPCQDELDFSISTPNLISHPAA